MRLTLSSQQKNDEMNHLLFSANMKLADMILANYKLLTILSCFNIHLGFGEKSVKEVCKQYDIPVSFFLLVCNVHTYPEYLPGEEELMSLDIDCLISYLQSSHQYYMSDKIGTIEKNLQDMNCHCEPQHRNVLQTFFNGYKNEVVSHFKYEEETVFPYIRGLMQKNATVNYHINQFEENHTNIEEKLSDLKNIIIKYLPDSCASKEQNDVLFEIFLFEEEINTHTLIEDRILIPFVQEIEKKYGERK